MTSTLTDRAFAAVLLDNDGTLTDSTAAVNRSWSTWAREYDLDLGRLRGYHGVPAATIVNQLVPEPQQEAALARIGEIEKADTEGVVALPGAWEAVQALGARGAIVTSATLDLASARLEAAGLPTPAVMITADDITAGKPDPQPFLRAAEALGVSPSDCLVVEDAPSGTTAARAAGCAVLAVLSTTPEEDLDADLIVPDLSHVAFVVNGSGVQVTVH
ncbi:MAG TPA: HAD-IA family hydrolase [Ornithinimicrobium sp.]|uniref:HAD-IA family hydrolase n=1 Tax=Ornithinimicrobium sp. TaxID=1977084 RepID=UPI002B481C66|nr:HAD-IA family hydrolase [Ornithinimicrobium sp.]HKJ11239.1 HAD-IA family hydrolase [Ornithinimicrobium sp.]